MGELLDYFVNKYKKDTSASKDLLERSIVKNAVMHVCEENLKEAGEVLTFEVLPNALPHMVLVIDEEPLKSIYDIVQVSPTLFEASLKEIDIGEVL